MKFLEFFQKWELTSVKISYKFCEAEFVLCEDDKEAAWEMYVELITRIITQRLNNIHGDEQTALDSVYSLFATTRSILKEKGRCAPTFSKIAIIILNQIVRPFTAKWHRESLQGAFGDPERCDQFRRELAELQKNMRKYAAMLANMAQVEDLTKLEDFDF